MPLQTLTLPAASSKPAEHDHPDLERELRALSLALSEGEGFRLILATYDVPRVRDSLIVRLRADLETRGVRLTCLDASVRRTDCDLLESLQAHLAASAASSDDGPRPAVAVLDLETCLDYHRQAPAGTGVLRRANLHRDAFAEQVRCPVVFWLMPVATSRFAQEAPDLWHWRIATFDFTGAPTEAVEPSDLTRATSFEEFRGLSPSSQHEGIAALQDRLLQLEHAAEGRTMAPSEQARRAALLDELGRGYSAMGHRDQALQATSEAVELRRRLASQRPDAFLPDLATSLNNLGAMQSNLGRWKEALPIILEAVEIRRRLAAQHPDVFLPDLAQTLNNLGVLQGYLGRPEEALWTTAEAVEIHRRLAAHHPDAFLPDLALSLNNFAMMLSQVGRREDALQAIAQAVEILRGLCAQRPDAFLPNLATGLNNLGNALTDLCRHEEALQTTAEAVEIRRRLALQRPDAVLPDLATSLNNLGNKLSNLGRCEEGQQATAEAVDILRRLAAQRPDAFLPDLALSLNNLGVLQSNLGRREEALQATGEAVRLTKPLVERYPLSFIDVFRTRIRNLRNRCEESDQDPDTDPLVCEATKLLARLNAAADT
jgi:tetratricopeptide (TPR) repeat protein